MSKKSKILIILIAVVIIYILFMLYPLISASFDDEKYVEGEVFTPVDGEYDFRKFRLNCSESRNFTAIVDRSGYAQLVDYRCGNTINIFEWDKMLIMNREHANSSLSKELENPIHDVDGITIIDIDNLPVKLYAAYAYDQDTNTAVYLSSPSENTTVEMIKTLRFNELIQEDYK